MSSIKIEGSTEVEETHPTKVKSDGNTKIQETNEASILSSTDNYHIVKDNIATITRNNDPEQWFLDMIENAISNSSLATSVSNLETTFNNFQDGVTRQITELYTKDTKLASDLSVVKVSNDSNTAGVSDLDIAKVTEDEAFAAASQTIASWQNNGEGGAWFNENIQTTTNNVTSLANQTSTLTATMSSQQSQIEALGTTITLLEKQVDGKVETWFGHQDVVDVDGNLIETAEPYVSWTDPAVHTGDTYVKTETNPTTGNEDILASWAFIHDTDTDTYNWQYRTDDTASMALQAAANAQSTADGKITTFYQATPPTDTESSIGDLWIDSDGDGSGNKVNQLSRYNGTMWEEVVDERITASVDRLDEATVDVNGVATAKSSLQVNANGVVTGFVANATNDPDYVGSTFNIFAERFVVSSTEGSYVGAPFTIEGNDIKFNGKVSFDNVTGDTNFVEFSDLSTPSSNTIIDGANIRTGYIAANRIDASYLSAISANLGTVNAGVMYNSGGTGGNYTMKIDLNAGEIHIK